MRKSDPFADKAVASFLEALPHTMTYSAMASACAEEFGAERSWSRTKIARYWGKTHRIRKGRPSRIDMDAKVRDFVEDRLGRRPYYEIAAECREVFGARAVALVDPSILDAPSPGSLGGKAPCLLRPMQNRLSMTAPTKR